MLKLSCCLLISLLIRILIFGASFGDALSLIGLAALQGYTLYMELKRQVPINKATLDRIIYLEEEVKKTKNHLGAVSLAASQRR